MRKIFTLLFIITISTVSFSQTLNDKELYGKWKVEKITKRPSNPQFANVVEGFKNSTFNFSQSGDFELKTTSKSEVFGMLTEMTNGTKWKVEEGTSSVKIGNEEDGYTIMGIVIRDLNENKIFHLAESGINLLMKKVE